jgi:hypothetical protein
VFESEEELDGEPYRKQVGCEGWKSRRRGVRFCAFFMARCLIVSVVSSC